MIDKATQMIARTLGISARNIHSWSFSCDYDRRSKMLNRLVVYCSPEHVEMRRLQERTGSWAVMAIEPTFLPGFNLFAETRLTIDLLHGKETQHMLKALHQTMTVRGPKRRKK